MPTILAVRFRRTVLSNTPTANPQISRYIATGLPLPIAFLYPNGIMRRRQNGLWTILPSSLTSSGFSRIWLDWSTPRW